jgi:hypothetical protein
VITANSFGFFLRGVAIPLDLGSDFISSGTIPTALVAPGAAGMQGLYPKRLLALSLSRFALTTPKIILRLHFSRPAPFSAQPILL